jgi:hexosaminidase
MKKPNEYKLRVKMGYFVVLFFMIAGSISCTNTKSGLSHSKVNVVAEIRLIPQPLTKEITKGTFDIVPTTRWILASDNAAAQRGIEIVLEEFQKATRFPLKLEKDLTAGKVKNALVFNLNGDKEKLGKEGYTLSVTPGNVSISAATPAGVFYGLQTLRQLFPPELEDNSFKANGWSLPCVEITDKPRFVWRGDMLDVSRHFLPFEFMKKNIDYLARYKMNTFHWHLTDDQGWRIESKKYPRLTEIGAWRVDHNDQLWWVRQPQKPGEKATYGGYYTQDEIREVVKYAAERFITVVPEIDMPGHSRATIASIPEIFCDGSGGPFTVGTGGVRSGNTLCPGKEETFKFIETLLTEVLPLFPGDYFDIGGDEANKSSWMKCPRCQARIKSEGLKDEHELQSYFIGRVEKIVNSHGKKLIGWDEILEGGLAPNAAVMSWRGERGGIMAAKMGHDVVMTPMDYCYINLLQGIPALEPPVPDLGTSQARLSTVYSYDPVPAELTEEEAKHVLGTQGNLWGEFVLNEADANYMLLPRLLAIAEVGWTPKNNRIWDDFVVRLEYNLKRLNNLGIKYAPSMYNVEVSTQMSEKEGFVKLALSTEHGKAPIRYSLDGSDPNENSELYKNPFDIDRTVMIKAAVFRGPSKIGRTTEKSPLIHKAAGITPVFSHPASKELGNAEARSLTDCLRGTLSRNSKEWVAFEGVDMIATLDLRTQKSVSSILVGCMERQSQRIFWPQKVDVLGSVDGTDFRLLGSVSNTVENRRESRAKDFKVSFPASEFRFIRIQAANVGACPAWSADAGKKALLYADEIIVE